MPWRRLVPLLAAAAAALLPLSALAADLRSELLPPAGAGWVEQLASADDGAMTAAAAAARFRDPQSARTMLQTYGFESGYSRLWRREADRLELYERVYLFGSAVGSAAWVDSVRSGDVDGEGWDQTYDTGSIPDSFGGYRTQSDGTYDSVVEFAAGDRAYSVSIVSATPPVPEPALDQALLLHSRAPDETFSAGATTTVAKAAAIGGGIFIALVAGVVLALVLLLRRRLPAPSPGGFVSPDGNWWWDGTRWVPVGSRPPAPPYNPGQ